MPVICIQCSLRALVRGEPVMSFDEDPAVHMQRLHSDPVATERERIELEAQLDRMMCEGRLPFSVGGDK